MPPLFVPPRSPSPLAAAELFRAVTPIVPPVVSMSSIDEPLAVTLAVTAPLFPLALLMASKTFCTEFMVVKLTEKVGPSEVAIWKSLPVAVCTPMPPLRDWMVVLTPMVLIFPPVMTLSVSVAPRAVVRPSWSAALFGVGVGDGEDSGAVGFVG